MTTINPYVSFNGKCREAMTFYQQCLGGELNFMKFSETPMGAQGPPEMKDHIMHSTLINGPLMLMGTDMAGPDGIVRGNSIAISVNCSSEGEIKTLYNKLAEVGTIHDPLEIKFWGGMFGVVLDQYGVTWMLNYNKDEQA